MSNLKQIALATLMYNQDYDERYMFEVWCNTGTGLPNWCWSEIVRQGNGLIYPYLKNQQILDCPSFDGWPSYGYNKLLARHKEAELSQPSRTVQWADSCGIRWFPYSVAGGCCNGGQAWPHRIGECQEDGRQDGPHNGGANIAYCDGHSKWQSIRSIPNEDDDAQSIWIRVR